MSNYNIERVRARLQELNQRMEELEEINQSLISEGKQEQFDVMFGIEYENISDEIYKQRQKLQIINKDENF